MACWNGSSWRVLSGVLIASFGFACASPESSGSALPLHASGEGASGGDASGAAVVSTPPRSATSGDLTLTFRPVPAPIPLNEPFELDVAFLDAEGRPAEVLGLTIDARMPEHDHGMLRKPRAEALGAGRFRVRGMLFHMAGRWELYATAIVGREFELAGRRAHKYAFEITLE